MPVVGSPSAPAGGTAVPTDGTFANANWVEVLYSDHDYTGRTILTNGLLLLDFSVGLQKLCATYLWNTALSTPAWQSVYDLVCKDNANNACTLRSITPIRIGLEESSIRAVVSTSGGKLMQITLRLQRGRYECRYDFTPLVEAETGGQNLILSALPAAIKIFYNSGKIADGVLGETSPSPQTDYGYGAAFIASATYPFIGGILYQNQSATDQPHSYGASGVAVGDGSTASLAVNARRSYGFFAIPYGASGSYSTANLQAEAEGGTLDAGWTSQANASASAGNEAKCANTTVATRADVFGTAFVPAAGAYDIWFRVKVTTNVGSAAEMTLGLWNSTDSTFVSSTTFNRTAMTTSYAWYRAATGVTPTATKSMRFRAVTALTLGTDWFIDEACMVPLTLTADNRGPQQLWQQFAYDRSVRLVRP